MEARSLKMLQRKKKVSKSTMFGERYILYHSLWRVTSTIQVIIFKPQEVLQGGKINFNSEFPKLKLNLTSETLTVLIIFLALGAPNLAQKPHFNFEGTASVLWLIPDLTRARQWQKWDLNHSTTFPIFCLCQLNKTGNK